MSSDRLSATFAALADLTRRAILAYLAKGEASVTKLAKPFEMSLPAISKHLKVLECAGYVTLTLICNNQAICQAASKKSRSHNMA
jgi:DNA-binding transcriptional ArsR family regulator